MGKQPPPVCYNAGTHTFVSSFYGGLQRRVGDAAATDGARGRTLQVHSRMLVLQEVGA